MNTGEINLQWGRKTVAKLIELGLRDVVISPGSRSTPLTYAFAESKVIESIPILDERSAGFFALGLAKVRQVPVAIVCTSGSAVANLLPAVVEARMSRTPLLLLTADRPPELQDCHAGQTIDQEEIFGKYAAYFSQVEVPSEDGLGSLEETLETAFNEALCEASPVHLNFPFQEPLLPEDNFPKHEEPEVVDDCYFALGHSKEDSPKVRSRHTRVLIIAGSGGLGLGNSLENTLLPFASQLGWPILADPLSNLRNSKEEGRDLVISHYDSILRDDKATRILKPQAVLQIGHLPTSKILRQRLKEWDCPGWTVSPFGENYDPLQSSREKLQIFPEALESTFQRVSSGEVNYAEAWQRANSSVAQQLQSVFAKEQDLFEGKVAWLLNEYMPKDSHLHIASSMPIRDVEFFWRNHPVQRTLCANRGANGIDGTLSTAMGVAQDSPPTYLLSGDLAFLHDINGLLIGTNPRFKGCLTVVLINNHGGGIFEHLPIAQQNPPFEEFFVTPQKVDFSLLAQAHNIPYRLIDSWENFVNLVANPTNHPIRILEIQTNRKGDTPKRKEILNLFRSNYST